MDSVYTLVWRKVMSTVSFKCIQIPAIPFKILMHLIHLFQGWWLSMDPKDTFFKKLQPLEDFAKLFEKSERFGSWNSKTLGIVLVSGET